MLFNYSEISFEHIHSMCKKCTPKQITLYQIALKLHKIIADLDNEISFEHCTLLEGIVCTSRQLTFEVYRNNKNKIGLNTTVNKLYLISELIGLDALNLKFVHFKKLMKTQFLKNGKT